MQAHANPVAMTIVRYAAFSLEDRFPNGPNLSEHLGSKKPVSYTYSLNS